MLGRNAKLQQSLFFGGVRGANPVGGIGGVRKESFDSLPAIGGRL